MKIERLLGFVRSFSSFLETGPSEPEVLLQGASLLHDLVAQDDWLQDEFSQPDPVYYQQYLLYADPLDRFSIVSFVWGPGQKTPIHDHMTWGLIGMLRGEELDTQYYKQPDGSLQPGETKRLIPGQVGHVSPSTHDVHQVANAFPDRPSISIHVYGGNIGRISRHVFDPSTGTPKTFISGYGNDVVPNLWR
jgi:predicted metal-dependent enzyme (double-stranded beta helix superfamily)